MLDSEELILLVCDCIYNVHCMGHFLDSERAVLHDLYIIRFLASERLVLVLHNCKLNLLTQLCYTASRQNSYRSD